MSLRTSDLEHILKKCQFHGDHIRLAKYFKKWSRLPKSSFSNSSDSCWKLELHKLLNSRSHNNTRRNSFDNLFNYKSLSRSSPSITEYLSSPPSFSSPPYFSYINLSYFFIFLFIFLFLIYKFYYNNI